MAEQLSYTNNSTVQSLHMKIVCQAVGTLLMSIAMIVVATAAFSQNVNALVEIQVPLPPFSLSQEIENPNEPCAPGEDNRSSDLCAQWKAADAAWDSANWAGRTFWLEVFGAVVGAATLVAALGAAYYAKRAAEETKRSADIADVTRRIGEAQARAYVTCVGATFRIDGNWLNCQISLRNTGQSPAANCAITARLALVSPFITQIGDPVGPTYFISEAQVGHHGSLSANETTPTPINIVWFEGDIPATVFTLYRDSDRIFDIECSMEWVDVFKVPNTAKFRLTSRGSHGPSAATHMQRVGSMTADNYSGDGIIEQVAAGRFDRPYFAEPQN